MPRVILASRSPRRSQLLASAGLRFEIHTPDEIDESWLQGEHPIHYTQRLAREKAGAAFAQFAETLRRDPVSDHDNDRFLTADTTVWLDPNESPLGKPVDRVNAHAMLSRLTSGQPHNVTTAYCLRTLDEKAEPLVREVTTQVFMRSLHPMELERYLDTNEWGDKAGGYAIQAEAASFVEQIRGSYTNVVGLPLSEVIQDLPVAFREQMKATS